MNYLDNLNKMLNEYNPIYKKDERKIFFKIDNEEYELYDNHYSILLFKKEVNIHIVPIMLSCTDKFMFTYINSLIKKRKKESKQLSLFDFLES